MSNRRMKKRMMMQQKREKKIDSSIIKEETQPVSERDLREQAQEEIVDKGSLGKKTAEDAIEKNLYLQYNNLEFSDKLMYQAALNDYCNWNDCDADSVFAINLYVKPEDGKAYYVINHDSEKKGSIDL